MLFPALSKPLISILLVGDHLCDDCCALNHSVSFPLYFSLIVSSASPVANPSQPTALPSTQERGRKVAQQLIPVPLLLWSISRNAVRAGQQCKHQSPFSFPPPALRPHSPSQLRTDLPPWAQFPPPAARHPPVSRCHKVSPWTNSKVHQFRANTTSSLLWIFCGEVMSILKTPYLSLRFIVAPLIIATAILGSNCSCNAAKGLSVCLCLPVSFRSHLWRAIWKQ